jgi:magnesium transporter
MTQVGVPGRLEVASTHATMLVPTFPPGVTAGAARVAMTGRQYEIAANVAVCEGDHLRGVVTIEALLAAPVGARLDEIMDDAPPVIGPDLDQEVVAWRAVQADTGCLAVVDAEGRFGGFVPAQRMLGVVLHEHAEDLARLGGFLHDSESARTASTENVGRRFWHRIPWLALGLFGAMAAAGVIGSFEATLERDVLIASFIPGVVYMADAVGTQTEALVIRGLSVGVGIRRVVRQELLTGLAVGGCLAVVFLALALLVWGNVEVAIAVSLALFAASSIATMIAMGLPWILHRLGRDPAFGSGPLATVVQDLLSITIYFAIASAIVT